MVLPVVVKPSSPLSDARRNEDLVCPEALNSMASVATRVSRSRYRAFCAASSWPPVSVVFRVRGVRRKDKVQKEAAKSEHEK